MSAKQFGRLSAFILLAALVGCGESKSRLDSAKETIVGMWEPVIKDGTIGTLNTVYHFKEDGTWSLLIHKKELLTSSYAFTGPTTVTAYSFNSTSPPIVASKSIVTATRSRLRRKNNLGTNRNHNRSSLSESNSLQIEKRQH
jgi:hypothetical protein